MGKLTRYEKETVINFNEGEGTASVYTRNRTLRRKLEKLAQERPDECRLEKVSRFGEAVDYIIPKSWVKINPSRILSDEQRAAMAENARTRFLSKNSQAITGEGAHEAAGIGKDIPQPSDSEKEA